ncbi:VWA domain-containing protein [Aporhodopirellula aestuarii]|uniref:VWA domain-containing protein n=1 Tax=Aporhodopirellula aestuarii TaxID=2950107 RepID=A0ABT0U3A9_9BACT|nr:VWA domain-containing protein [Aporhodopirellula aestuarii]MCM2371374.1 VWA domain-containing protein [Aporhodopirellula aestuarii]
MNELVDWLPEDSMIGNPAAVWWIIAAMMAGVTCFLVVALRYRAQRRFATEDRLDDFFDRTSFFARHRYISAILSAVVVCSVLSLLTVALMDIRWGKSEQEVPQKGIEIMFLLDVSRSMLAEDVAPNRLERAKQMMRDMLQRMAGDRVGLVVFAGETRQTIPLTNHYEDFSQMLEDVNPSSVRRGGSRLGDAIASAGRAFLSKTNAHRVIVVLTDGEDQESEPVKMAKRLHDDENIRIFTVGLGDMNSGARIPDVDREQSRRQTGSYVKYNGEPVWSKMNGEILREIATETEGAYIPAETKHVDMGEIYDRYIAGLQTTEFETAKVDAYVARFQWFALPAFVLLLIDFASRLSWRRSSVETMRKSSIAGLAFLIALAQPAIANAQTNLRQFTQAYNHGVELYRQGELETAADEFSRAIGSPDDEVAAAARFNLGTTCYARAVQMLSAEESQPNAAAESTEVAGPDQVKEVLGRGIEALRSALRLNPDWADARVNLEKAVRLRAEIEKQQQQQQNENQNQQQDSEQPKSDQQESEQQNSEQSGEGEEQQQEQPDQQQPQDSGDSGSGEQSDSSGQPENEPSEEQQAQDSQSDEGDESESQSQPESPEQSPSNSDQSESSSGEPQQDMDDDSQGNEPSETEGENQQPTDPADVSGELSSDNSGDGSSTQNASSVGAGEQAEDDRPMTAEEAMKMLQAIRDRDMIRRFRLQQMQQRRQIPVEKDW